jgi:hypothetical protein
VEVEPIIAGVLALLAAIAGALVSSLYEHRKRSDRRRAAQRLIVYELDRLELQVKEAQLSRTLPAGLAQGLATPVWDGQRDALAGLLGEDYWDALSLAYERLARLDSFRGREVGTKLERDDQERLRNVGGFLAAAIRKLEPRRKGAEWAGDWTPGKPGKGFVAMRGDRRVWTWPTDEAGGPHHPDMEVGLRQTGLLPESVGVAGYFAIDVDGHYTLFSTPGTADGQLSTLIETECPRLRRRTGDGDWEFS